jgi:hypothetical protein
MREAQASPSRSVLQSAVAERRPTGVPLVPASAELITGPDLEVAWDGGRTPCWYPRQAEAVGVALVGGGAAIPMAAPA